MTGMQVSEGLKRNNVTLKSTDGKEEGKGDIHINDGIRWDANTLTLNAQNDININRTLNGTGTAKLALEYGQGTANGIDNKGLSSDYYLQRNTAVPFRNVRINLPEGDNFILKKGNAGKVEEFKVIHQMPSINIKGISLLSKNNTDNNFAIGTDIDLSYTSNYDGFSGWSISEKIRSKINFHGLGHQLNNLNIINNRAENSALFIQRPYGIIRDLSMLNVNINGGDNSGGIVGYGDNIKIHNIYITGKIKGNHAGGIIGSAHNNTIINNSYTNVNIEGSSNAGGLVGEATTVYYGGLNINDSHSLGNIKSNYSGGLIGYADAGNSSHINIGESSFKGNIEGNIASGGLIGAASSFSYGLSGNTILSIKDSYASGKVFSKQHAGGLVGDTYLSGVDAILEIKNNYTTNSVLGNKDVGGLIGYGRYSNGGSANNGWNTFKKNQ